MDSIQGNHFKDFLDVLFKRKVMILLFFFATVLTAIIGVSFFQKVEYEAYSNILIETSRGYVSERSLPTNDPRQRSTDGPSLSQQVDLALQVLKGNKLATKIVEAIGPSNIYEDIGEPGLKKKLLRALGLISPKEEYEMPLVEIAALRLQQELLVFRTGTFSSVILVAFRHRDPVIAADVVNSLVDLYIERHLELHKKPRLTRFFQEQYANKKSDLDAAEYALQEFKSTYGITSSPEEATSFIVDHKKTLQVELDDTIGQQAELDNKIMLLRHQLANTARNPKAINALQTKLVELQVREGELSVRFKDESRSMRNLRAEIQQTEDKLGELGYNKRYGSKSSSSSSTLYSDLQEKLLEAELTTNSLEARREVVTTQLTEYDARIKDLGNLKVEFARLEENLSAAREYYRLYQTKYEEFRIFDALDAEGIANIKALDIAHIPLSPIPPKTLLILLLSIFFGAFGGMGLALFIELFSGTLKKREDTEQYLQRPVLATIPEFGPGGKATVPGKKRRVAL